MNEKIKKERTKKFLKEKIKLQRFRKIWKKEAKHKQSIKHKIL